MSEVNGMKCDGTGVWCGSPGCCPKVESPVQGAASATCGGCGGSGKEVGDADCPPEGICGECAGTGRAWPSGAASASGAKGAAVKPWEERTEETGPSAMLLAMEAEIADWRALAERAQAQPMEVVYQVSHADDKNEWADIPAERFQEFAHAGWIVRVLYTTPAPEQPDLTPMQALGEALKLVCPPLNRGEWATFEAAIRNDNEQQTVHTVGFVRGASHAPEQEAAQVAPPGAQEAVAWAVTAPRGGIHKLSITRDSAERKAAKWREEWPDNGCSVRPLVFGDTAHVPATTPAEQAQGGEA